MKYAVILFIGIVFGSCFSEGDCLVTATNFMDIQFRKKINNTLDSAVALTSISLSNTDSVIAFKHDTTVSEIVIPVDIHHNTTTFIFYRKGLGVDSTITASDTLEVSYTIQSRLITTNCGAYTYYENLKIVHTNLESQIKVFSTSLIKRPHQLGLCRQLPNILLVPALFFLQ